MIGLGSVFLVGTFVEYPPCTMERSIRSGSPAAIRIPVDARTANRGARFIAEASARRLRSAPFINLPLVIGAAILHAKCNGSENSPMTTVDCGFALMPIPTPPVFSRGGETSTAIAFPEFDTQCPETVKTRIGKGVIRCRCGSFAVVRGLVMVM